MPPLSRSGIVHWCNHREREKDAPPRTAVASLAKDTITRGESVEAAWSSRRNEMIGGTPNVASIGVGQWLSRLADITGGP